MKRLALLGSTGSIGTQTLDVVARFPDRLSVVALAAGRSIDLLVQQCKQFRPELCCVARPDDAARVREAVGDPKLRVVSGAQGLVEVATADAELVVGALVGSAGLAPVVAALELGRDVALANKEVLVTGGPLVLELARRTGAKVLPIDSEHVAIAQCIAGHPRDSVRKIWLTASGGPFRRASAEAIGAATPDQALKHPNWDMGAKITIDSATLMNKGFEVIEARWLFDLPVAQIGVLVHPESIIHSLVEFSDGAWLAQLGIPDMRIPIAYTLGMPDRLPLPDLPALDLLSLGALHFEAPDLERFPALRIAFQALAAGGTAPAALNAANEIAVAAFLAREIPFTAIAETAEEVLEALPVLPGLSLAEICEVDERARAHARRRVEERLH